jgi:hypothetical protein
MSLIELFVFILASYGFVVAIELTPFPGTTLTWLKEHKPFSCNCCLSFWFTFLFCIFGFGFNLIYSLLYGFAACGAVTFIKFIEMKIAPLGINPNEIEE